MPNQSTLIVLLALFCILIASVNARTILNGTHLYTEGKDWNSELKPRNEPLYRIEHPDAWDLRILSQPIGSESLEDLDFVSFSNGGVNTCVYLVINSVVDVNNDEFGSGVIDQKFLISPNYRSENEDPSHDFLGTCLASKIAGVTSGVAKRSRIIIVKITDVIEDYVWAIQAIAEDIEGRRSQSSTAGTCREGRVVVAFLSSSQFSATHKLYEQIIFREKIDYLRKNKRVFFVTGAGDHAGMPGRQNVDSWPAILASEDFPIIVVGASNYLGEAAPFSQGGGRVTAWAPGAPIMCAEGLRHSLRFGTAGAAAVMAGFLAVFLSLDKAPFHRTPRDFREFLSSAGTYTREKGNTRVIWNGLNGTHIGGLEK